MTKRKQENMKTMNRKRRREINMSDKYERKNRKTKDFLLINLEQDMRKERERESFF